MIRTIRVPLGQIVKKIGSGATPRGGGEVYLDIGVSFIRSQNILNNEFKREGLVCITDEHATQLANVEVVEGDVLLNITGDSVARVCQAPKDVLPARVNQHVAIIRPDPEKLDASFLKYFLVRPESQDHLLALASSGATRNALTKSMIERLEVPLPPLYEQRRIAGILGAFDDQIEVLRQQNRTLEAMARALFRHWFVDFEFPSDGSGGVAEGLPYRSSGGRMVDSPLGEIPEGWQVGSLDSVASFLNGLPMQKYPSTQDEESIPVIKIRELRQGITESSDRASKDIPPVYIIQNGDLLFSWSGSLEVIFWTGGVGALNQHLFKVTSAEYPMWFIYQSLMLHLQSFRDIASDKATTMGHIQRHHLAKAFISIPERLFLERIPTIIDALTQSRVINKLKIANVSNVRDGLITSLMMQ